MTNETHLEKARQALKLPDRFMLGPTTAMVHAGMLHILAHLEQQVAGASEGVPHAVEVALDAAEQKVWQLEAKLAAATSPASEGKCSGYCTAENHASDCPKYAVAPASEDVVEPKHQHVYDRYSPANEVRGPIWTCRCNSWVTVPPAVQGEERATADTATGLIRRMVIHLAADHDSEDTCEEFMQWYEEALAWLPPLAASSPAVPTESAGRVRMADRLESLVDELEPNWELAYTDATHWVRAIYAALVAERAKSYPGPLPAQTEGGERCLHGSETLTISGLHYAKGELIGITFECSRCKTWPTVGRLEPDGPVFPVLPQPAPTPPPGEWFCESCKSLNHPSNGYCRNCSQVRPDLQPTPPPATKYPQVYRHSRPAADVSPTRPPLLARNLPEVQS